MRLVYCERCGYFLGTLEDVIEKCPACDYDKIVMTTDQEFCPNFVYMTHEEQEKFLIDYLGHGFEFEYEDKRRYHMEMHTKRVRKMFSDTPKCPTCQSTNLKKISGTKRWISTGLFGLASSNIGKTFECRSCGYKW